MRCRCSGLRGIATLRDVYGDQVVEPMDRLSTLPGWEVDLVMLDQAPALLRHQVLRHGTLLHCGDERLYGRFRGQTLDDYELNRYLAGRAA